ncbi:MAG: hypothetical protein HY026_00460 [Deltaproteobacteria bacterium]|nr:hypothetical protein [Deltaproteobacteria bacterium]
MGFKTILIALFVVLGGGRVGAEVADIPAPVNPHDFEKREFCPVCHVVTDMPKLNHDIITTCVKCHEGNINSHPVIRHPVSVKVSHKVSVPEWMPLPQGKLVCYTCHDYHNKSGLKRMLRIDYEILCVSCHTTK